MEIFFLQKIYNFFSVFEAECDMEWERDQKCTSYEFPNTHTYVKPLIDSLAFLLYANEPSLTVCRSVSEPQTVGTIAWIKMNFN